MQKKYQRLQDANMDRAKRIYAYLKFNKAMSENTFAALYYGYPPDWKIYMNGSYTNNTKTTKQFLYDHGLMELKLINNLRVYVATQKCVRTKTFENATKEVQMVNNVDIDRAINYVTLNNNQIPLEYEGPIVANILQLEGNHFKTFVRWYNEFEPTYYGTNKKLPIKFKVLNPVTYLEREGLIKKHN